MKHQRNARLFSKLIGIFLGSLLGMLICNPAAVQADDPAARAIMEKVDARDDGDNRTADMQMVLIDKKGRQRLRRIRTFSKGKGADVLSLMFFLHPADVKDTAFLTYDYDDAAKDDDQWLYLPALQKTKRIATSDKSGSFMGSDLNYADMTSLDLEDYDFSFYAKGREKTVNGKNTWVIWAHPRSAKVVRETGYEKALLFVRQDNHFVVRILSWVSGGRQLKYFDVKKLDQIDGIWVATELHVTRKKGKQMVHKTILTLDNVKFNQDLEEALFSIRKMEKGI